MFAKQKIAFISTMPGAPWGGSEELWCEAASKALGKKHDVLLSVHQWPVLHPRIKSILIEGGKLHTRERYNPQATLIERVIKRIKYRYLKINPYEEILKFGPDIICISQAGSFDFCTDILLQNVVARINKPFALICHTSLIEGTVLNTSTRERARQLFNQAKFVAFVAQRTKALAEKAITGEIQNALILRNPVNLAVKERSFYPSQKCACLVSIGNLSIDSKGYDLLLEVLGGEKWQKRNWRLSVYGVGKDEEYLRDLISFYQLEEKVTLMGFTSDIKEVWRKNHLLVIPSRLESAPLVLVEAMLCGRAAVATDVGGISEWLEHGVTGFLAEAATIQHIDRAMESAWQNRQLWEQMGTKAFEKAMKMVDPYPGETLINLLLNE
jgi:glycosyltransferase involved in cell wall biosynthesis